jgi:TfoX/Sxy family transcriptional regulator of competence genes
MPAAPRWKKSSAERIALFEAVLSGQPGAERRQMFGYPAAFVNGNLATGLHQDDWMVRLGEQDRAALAAKGGRPFEPMPGRPMREYVVLPKAVLSERRALVGWIRRGIDYTAALPAKREKKKAAKRSPARKK